MTDHTTTSILSKQTLRIEAMRHRDRIDAGDPSERTDSACHLFMEHIHPQKEDIVALYYPKGREFSTLTLMDSLMQQGVTCALPVVKPDTRVLEFYTFSDHEILQEGRFGISEPVTDGKSPVTPDIVVVPLLAFDRKGRRLGYGGGYYDATLAALSENGNRPLSVGLAYAKQAVLFNLPHEDHDIALDWVITPQAAHYFGT